MCLTSPGAPPDPPGGPSRPTRAERIATLAISSWVTVAAAYAVALSATYYLLGGWKPHRVETAWIIFGAAVATGLAARVVRRQRPSGAADGETRTGRWAFVLLLAATLVVYGRALGVGFLSDDFVLLERSAGTLGWEGYFRPLPLWIFRAADRTAPLYAAGSLHALNMALHLLNGWCVWLIARRMGRSRQAGFMAAALFLLFPASVEPVVWCSGLQDLLATAGSLAVVTVALGSGGAALILGSLSIALLSKEIAVAAPFIALALVRARDDRVNRSTMTALVVAGIVSLAFAIWRLQLAGDTFAATPSRYFLKNMLSNAFGSLAVPLRTDEIRHLPAAGILAAVTIAAAGIAAVGGSASGRAARVALALMAWIVLAIFPVYSLFFVSNQLEGSRYLYLASAAWSLLLPLASAEAAGMAGRVARTGVTVLVLFWTVAAYQHVSSWVRAGEERDRILAAASDADPACQFAGVTDNLQGAYVFRNGFDAALKRQGIRLEAGADCTNRWNGTSFVARPN